MHIYGANPHALGCEVCKPALASIFVSLYNEPVLSIAAVSPAPSTATVSAITRVDAAVASPGGQTARARRREDDEDVLCKAQEE